MYSLRMSFWTVPRSLLAGDALLLGRQLVEQQQERRGRVDRHRGRDAVERNALEDDPHVLDRVDGDTRPADLPLRHRVVRVVAELRRQIEGDRQAGLAELEEVAKALVRLLRGTEARVLADRPRPAAVHRRVRAARERELAGQLRGEVGDVLRRVHRLDLDARVGLSAVLRLSHAAIVRPPGRASSACSGSARAGNRAWRSTSAWAGSALRCR